MVSHRPFKLDIERKNGQLSTAIHLSRNVPISTVCMQSERDDGREWASMSNFAVFSTGRLFPKEVRKAMVDPFRHFVRLLNASFVSTAAGLILIDYSICSGKLFIVYAYALCL